jgi:hypothetical protein
MKRGLYRVRDPLLGEAAIVDKSAGDAAPYLSRYLYELLEFEPEFDCLPWLARMPRCKYSSPGSSPQFQHQ